MKKISAEDYKIEIIPDQDNKNEFLAYIPQLDCWGDGKTIDDAIKDVIDVGNDIIEMAIQDGVGIPMPKHESIDEEYSGKLSLRLPKYLHCEIAKRADKEGCSINQLIQSFIAMGIGLKYGEEKITINIDLDPAKIQKSLVKDKKEWFKDFENNIDSKMNSRLLAQY